jgi:hypothetical protein
MSQLCRVNQDPDERSGLLGVIAMKGLIQNVIFGNFLDRIGKIVKKPAETQTNIWLAIHLECLTPFLEDVSLNPLHGMNLKL